MSRIKNLDKASLNKLQALETKLGCCIVALKHQPKPATLSRLQLEEYRQWKRN